MCHKCQCLALLLLLEDKVIFNGLQCMQWKFLQRYIFQWCVFFLFILVENSEEMRLHTLLLLHSLISEPNNIKLLLEVKEGVSLPSAAMWKKFKPNEEIAPWILPKIKNAIFWQEKCHAWCKVDLMAVKSLTGKSVIQGAGLHACCCNWSGDWKINWGRSSRSASSVHPRYIFFGICKRGTWA